MAVSSNGKKQPTKMRKMAARSPTPNQRMAIGNPGQRRDGAKDLNQGVERHLCPAVPADDEPQRNGQNSGQNEIPR